MAAPMKPRNHALADRLLTALLFLQFQIAKTTPTFILILIFNGWQRMVWSLPDNFPSWVFSIVQVSYFIIYFG